LVLLGGVPPLRDRVIGRAAAHHPAQVRADGPDQRVLLLFLLAALAAFLFAEERESGSSGHDDERRVGVEHPRDGHLAAAEREN